jgi:predicted  nucleic acid-binding Zn-ribbon protein
VDAEQRRRVEAAQLEATEAAGAAASARETLTAIDRRISELSLQLAQQRRLLAEAQRQVRGAESRVKAAQLALTRAGGST